ncbi:MAG: hypothetical protein [Arizlama microvirus]|nr:MAG: hypothetical protein [Arizlama microvirus]
MDIRDRIRLQKEIQCCKLNIQGQEARIFDAQSSINFWQKTLCELETELNQNAPAICGSCGD